jgi:hypothetical protein
MARQSPNTPLNGTPNRQPLIVGVKAIAVTTLRMVAVGYLMLRSFGCELVCVSRCDIPEHSTAVTVGSFGLLAVVLLLSVFGLPAMFAPHCIVFHASSMPHLAAIAYNPSSLPCTVFH